RASVSTGLVGFGRVRPVGLRLFAAAVGLLLPAAAAQASTPAARVTAPRGATVRVPRSLVLTAPQARVICADRGRRCRVQAKLALSDPPRAIASRSFWLAPGKASALRFHLSTAGAEAVRKAGTASATLTIVATKHGFARAKVTARLTLT